MSQNDHGGDDVEYFFDPDSNQYYYLDENENPVFFVPEEEDEAADPAMVAVEDGPPSSVQSPMRPPPLPPQQQQQQPPTTAASSGSLKGRNAAVEPNPISSEFPVGSTSGQQDGRRGNTTPPANAVDVLPQEAVAKTLMRTYEFEDWQPVSNGWLADTCTEMFFSLAFRLYFTAVFGATGVLIFLLLLSYIFATLYRLFDPPKSDVSSTWQGIAYFVIFLSQSMVSTAIICTWMDMLKGFWGITPDDTRIWGLHHRNWTQERPPFAIHGAIVFFTMFFPFIWACIETIATGKSVLFVAQQTFYISMMVMAWFVAFAYILNFFNSMKEKREAYKNRFGVDDIPADRVVHANGQSTKRAKRSWYYSESSLEEYGLDKRTLGLAPIAFAMGLIPLFSIYTAYSRDHVSTIPNSDWVALIVVFVAVMMFLYQLLASKNHSHRASLVTLFLIVLFFILGLVGCGVSVNGSLFGVLIFFLFASQALLLRKRNHQLTRKEVCKLMNVALERVEEEEKKDEQFDTYLFFCRKTFFAALFCFDIKTLFGYRHPTVREYEKAEAIKRPTLRSDIKVLMVFWLSIFFCMIFIVGIGRAIDVKTSDQHLQAGRSSTAIVGDQPSLSVCQLRFGTNGSSFSIYDATLLATLGYDVAVSVEKAYATWFYDRTTLVREYPNALPSTYELLTAPTKMRFTAYRDRLTGFRIIVLHAPPAGINVMRALDEWGDALAVQFASILSPTMIAWPEESKREFVRGSGFFRQALGKANPLEEVEQYIQAQLSNGVTVEQFLLVGDGFAGGYAKLLSARIGGLAYVALNAPGVELTLTDSPKALSNGVDVSLDGALLSLIDQPKAQSSRMQLVCPSDLSMHGCSHIYTLATAVLSACGDSRGRSLGNHY